MTPGCPSWAPKSSKVRKISARNSFRGRPAAFPDASLASWDAVPGTPQRPSPTPRLLPPTPRWPPGRRSALLQFGEVGDLGLEMRERRFGVDCGGDPVLPGAEGDGALAIAAQRGIGDHRQCRGRTVGRNRAALVAGHFLGAVLVRHGQAIDAEQSPQLGPGDLTVPRDQGEQVLTLGTAHHQGLDDVAGLDAPGCSGLGERGHVAMAGEGEVQPGRLEGCCRTLLVHGATIDGATGTLRPWVGGAASPVDRRLGAGGVGLLEGWIQRRGPVFDLGSRPWPPTLPSILPPTRRSSIPGRSRAFKQRCSTVRVSGSSTHGRTWSRWMRL